MIKLIVVHKECSKKGPRFTVTFRLIHPLFTIGGAAHARNLVCIVLDVEFVIVGELFATIDSPFGENDDTQVPLDLDRFRDTVRVTRVVDVPGQTAGQCCIDHAVFVQAEHVDTTILKKE